MPNGLTSPPGLLPSGKSASTRAAIMHLAFFSAPVAFDSIEQGKKLDG